MTLLAISAAAVAASPAASAAATTGTIASIGAFIGGWAFLLLAIFVIAGIWSENSGSSGWAVFWLIVAGVVAFVAFDVPLYLIAIGAACYIVVGMFWSYWRYKKHVVTMVERARKHDEYTRKTVLKELHPSEMIGKITMWTLVWPFSLIENFIGDAIDLLKGFISRFFRGLYFRVYDSAVKALTQ